MQEGNPIQSNPGDGQLPQKGTEGLFGRHVLLPNHYAWFVLASSLDLLMTWVVLHVGGYEANELARYIIERFDLYGVLVFKFALVIVVIGICEFVGMRRHETGRRLATWAIIVPSLGVLGAMVVLVRVGRGEGPMFVTS